MSEGMPKFERKEMNEGPAKVGDYVTAKLVESDGVDNVRQGLFVEDKGDGTVLVQGQMGQYLCKGPEGLVIVPDRNLFGDALDFVVEERKKLGLDNSTQSPL